MIISMKMHATKEEIAEVKARIEEFGYKVHSIDGEQRVVIGAVGVGDVTACLESLEAMPQVERAVRISAPYKFVSREFRAAKTEIAVISLGKEPVPDVARCGRKSDTAGLSPSGLVDLAFISNRKITGYSVHDKDCVAHLSTRMAVRAVDLFP